MEKIKEIAKKIPAKGSSDRRFPRVLIISHTPLSDTRNNGKTQAAFFRQWDQSSLAQLYLSTDVPDFSICNKFFQLHDIDILKRLLWGNKVQGRRVSNLDAPEIQEYKKKIKNNFILKKVRNNYGPLLRILRDLMWQIGDFRSNELIRFIEDFHPEIIFFESSNAVFAFSIARWISNYYNIPLIMHTTDDYVSGKLTIDPFFWIHMLRLRNAYKWATSYADCIIAISEKMECEYKIRFGGNYFVAANCTYHIPLPKRNSIHNPVKFLYAGNLALNRWKVLALISECLKELFIQEGLKGELIVYSLTDPSIKVLSHLNKPPFIMFKGAINTSELNNAKENSDVLIHVEAFDRKNRHITRLSLSTKIPEYLASGRCILAVGPKDVASMQYIAKYDLGVTVMSESKYDIKRALKEIMLDSNKRTFYAEKGIQFAYCRHNPERTSKDIFHIISASVNNK